MKKVIYTTQEVADLCGVHRDTILRHLKKRLIKCQWRNGRGWRVWSATEVEQMKEFYKHRKMTINTGKK